MRLIVRLMIIDPISTVIFFLFFFFFFQAEDGIRDPLWSRGLGDVYKEQDEIPPVP